MDQKEFDKIVVSCVAISNILNEYYMLGILSVNEYDNRIQVQEYQFPIERIPGTLKVTNRNSTHSAYDYSKEYLGKIFHFLSNDHPQDVANKLNHLVTDLTNNFEINYLPEKGETNESSS